MFNWKKDNERKVKKELNDLEIYLKENINKLYPNVNILELRINMSPESTWFNIGFTCKYEYGPRSYIIYNAIEDRIKTIVRKYNEYLDLYIKIGSVHRTYSNDLILKTGEKYLKWVNQNGMPYNINTIQYYNVKIGECTTSLYSFIMNELTSLDNINPNCNGE